METYRQRLQKEGSVDPDTKLIADSEFGVVLVLYTGGTIGMKVKSDAVYMTEKDFLHNWLSSMPSFNDPVFSDRQSKLCKDPPFYDQLRYKPLYMPVVSGTETKHIQYILMEYSPLIDSSNADFDNMLQIALDIKKYYKKFDGFVILHGTDTMCYTAAALSFILENLGKTVILTGAQIPIYETRSDGRDNFQGALIMAAKFVIPEVCIFFDNHLLRGNRARKVSADTLDAFDSPNFPALGKLEVNVSVYWDLIQRATNTRQFNVHTLLCPNVAILRIFPSISADVVRAFLRHPIEGVVMQCYGAGNFPDQNIELIEVMIEACKRGIIIVNTTQCRRGAVSISYAGAKSLLDAGVVAGYDMTSEAALAKLSYVLTKPWPLEEKRKFISRNIRGELTTKESMPKSHPLSSALEALGLDSDTAGVPVNNMKELRETLVTPLMCLAIRSGNLQSLAKLCETFPGNLLTADYDGRTALHIAVRDGSYELVKYLLNNGASVHARDRFNRNSLIEAVYSRRLDIIELLYSTGAHMQLHPEHLAAELNEAASRGDLELLRAFWHAGATLDVWDYSRRTPLHTAILYWHVDIVEYLLKHGANPEISDDTGRTCFSLSCHQHIVNLLESALEVKAWTKLKRRPSNLATNNSLTTTSSTNHLSPSSESLDQPNHTETNNGD